MQFKFKPSNDEARRWFAWYPVYVKESSVWAWLEFVIRRPERIEGYRFWYYRLSQRR